MGSNGAMHTASSILRLSPIHSSSKLFHTDSSSFKYILCRIGEVLYNEIPTNGFGVKIGNGFFFSRRYFAKYVEEMYLNACCSSGTIICNVKTESINLFGVPVARNRRVSLNSSSTHPTQTQENRQETMFSFK